MTSRSIARSLAGPAALSLSACAALAAPSPDRAPGAPDPVTVSVLTPGAAPVTLTRRQAAGLEVIRAHVFAGLSPDQRAAVVDAGEFTPPAQPEPDAPYMHLKPLGDEEYRTVRGLISHDDWLRLKPVHQHALVAQMEALADGKQVPQFCFAPGTDPALVNAFSRLGNYPFGDRFQQVSRWTSTATGSTGTRGTRITLRYSFVPDGTMVPDLNGVQQPSNLFARLNSIYGSPSVWQALYAQVLTKWSSLIGVTYVYEPNDDGRAINPNATGSATAPGVIGVRGDCRFSGAPLDGNFNVLAFNYFPSTGGGAGGDMVLDTNDSFFTQLGSNSLALRNVVAHEHGHGLGFAHVCPINQTKLMEPTWSGAYDGPRLDDVLNGQRFYGDPLEPNNSAAAATPATTTSPSPSLQLSLDGPADQDWFAYTVPAGTSLTVTATPPGVAAYLSAAQTSQCTATTTYDPRNVNPLIVELRTGSGGATVVATSTSVLGAAASATYLASTTGTVYARVYTTGTTDGIQGYTLAASTQVVSAVQITLPNGAPTLLSPAAPTTFNVQVVALNDTLATARLFYRYVPGAYTAVDLAPAGSPNQYTATLPPCPCGSSPQFYIRGAGAIAVATSPDNAPTNVYAAATGAPGVVFADDFSTDKGWTYGAAGDTATAGLWERGNPIGTSVGGVPCQPDGAFSPPACAFTGQGSVGGSAGASDVDGGFTTLLSPRINLAGSGSPVLTYQRWYSNNLGSQPGTNTFRVDLSADDGQSWTNAETVGPNTAQSQGGWFQGTVNIAQFITPSATTRIRFVADDATGAIVEAAIDDVQITGTVCSTAPPCRADFNQNGSVELTDIFQFLNAWFGGNITADFNQNGSVELTDIFAFLNAWFAGCP